MEADMAQGKINGQIIDENGKYKYSNVELTPNVFADLMVHLLNGKQFKRQYAIDLIVDYHTKHGGISHRDSYVDTFKKVTQKSAIHSSLSNVGFGSWILSMDDTNDTIEVVKDEKTSNNISFEIDEVLGEGSGTVYVYYYDVYKERAFLNGRTIWECKVGKTDRNVLDRIFSQTGTAYPEYPHVALLIKCPSAREMEDALHSILKLRGKWMENAPGSEWFLTSPDEIKDLYWLITGKQK